MARDVVSFQSPCGCRSSGATPPSPSAASRSRRLSSRSSGSSVTGSCTPGGPAGASSPSAPTRARPPGRPRRGRRADGRRCALGRPGCARGRPCRHRARPLRGGRPAAVRRVTDLARDRRRGRGGRRRPPPLSREHPSLRRARPHRTGLGRPRDRDRPGRRRRPPGPRPLRDDDIRPGHARAGHHRAPEDLPGARRPTALDCHVLRPGLVRVGDAAEVGELWTLPRRAAG